MFLLNGHPLSPDVAFTDAHGIQRPANWLRLSTPEEKAEAGITEVPDPAPYDQRFQWGWTDDGQPIWKDHGELVAQWQEHTRTTAGLLLAPSDWMVIREQDNGVAVPENWRTWRETVRLAAGSKVFEIGQTVDTEALAAYVTSQEYASWPNDPRVISSPVSDDGVQFASNGISTGF